MWRTWHLLWLKSISQFFSQASTTGCIFSKIYIVPCSFLPQYKCFSARWKILFSLVFKQLELTSSINFGILVCLVCHMIAYKIFEKHSISSIHFNAMHLLWRSKIVSIALKICIFHSQNSLCIHKIPCACRTHSTSNLFHNIEQIWLFKMIPNINGFVVRLQKNWTMLSTFQMPLVNGNKLLSVQHFCLQFKQCLWLVEGRDLIYKMSWIFITFFSSFSVKLLAHV